MYDVIYLAPPGSTGSQNGPTVFMGAYEALIFQFIVEAVGVTPTVTFKIQGSVDGTTTGWFDVGYITDTSDTISVATRTVIAVGNSIAFLSNPVARRYRYYRYVTSANTNVTFRVEAYPVAD